MSATPAASRCLQHRHQVPCYRRRHRHWPFCRRKAINRMLQLSPVVIDKLGAASVMSGDKRYETADDMQVYLWSNGQYFATSLPKINTEDYKLIGWYDNFGCSGGKKIRILVAVKTN